MIKEYVGTLADELHVQLAPGEAEQIASNHNIDDLLALATYARRLLERARTGEAEPADLVLWRKFAWSLKSSSKRQGSPKPDLSLTVETIVKVERSIIEQFRQRAITGDV